MAGSVGRVYRDRGDRWFIQLPGRVRIWCDKAHRTFYSRQHAEWTLNQVQGEIENGTFDADYYSKTRKSVHSFEVYATEWLSNCERRLAKGELSPTYMREVRRYVAKYFLPAFGPLNMQDIKGRQLKSFYLGMEDISQKTTYNIMAVLKKLFRDAHEEEVLQAMPRFPKVSMGPEPETVWADVEQQDAILQRLDPETAYFVLFQMCHGTRNGETRALQHRDINLKDETVTIRRAFSGTLLRPFTKTRRVRVIPLDLAWKEIYLSRPTSIDPQQFVFLRNGKPFSTTWATKKWKEAAIEAGYANVTLYEGTRHSLASQAVNRGVPLYVIQKFLGHTSPKMTERYSHLKTSGLRQAQRQASVINIDSAKCLQMENRENN